MFKFFRRKVEDTDILNVGKHLKALESNADFRAFMENVNNEKNICMEGIDTCIENRDEEGIKRWMHKLEEYSAITRYMNSILREYESAKELKGE